MEIKRRTEILIETQREIVVHDSASSGQINCPQCGETMLAPEHAAACGIGRRAAYQLVEQTNAHFVETEAGVVMLCLPWLSGILSGAAKQLTENEEFNAPKLSAKDGKMKTDE